ncbi:MAG: SGNH/GDSL hydrolase family protein [Planctomycetes bacterium]|nr:SGNH/GDSL hydrolase family protein [Planctomycetota bacterium]
MQLALALLSALCTVALVEGSLRIVAALRTGRAPLDLGPKLRADGTQVRRVLCLGDSNTYGLYERTEDAWPAKVEALLNEAAPVRTAFELVNEGFPGQNSSDLRTRCAAAIDRCDPDLLVIWVGKNNTWSTRNMEPYLEGESAAAGPPILRDLLIYRLFRTLEGRHVSERSIDLRDLSRGGGVSSRDAFEISMQYGEGGADVTMGLALRALAGDLAEISRLAERKGIAMLVLSYPIDLDRLRALNTELSKLASDARWGFLDLRGWIAAALRRARYEELFHHDFHLRALGYATLARFLAPAIDRALGSPCRMPPAQIAELDALLAPPLRRLHAIRGDTGFAIEAHGPPNAAYLVLGGEGAPSDVGTPLPPYHLLPIALSGAVHSGALDASGSARFEIPAEWAGKSLVLATQAAPFVVAGEQSFDTVSFGLSDPLALPR